MEDIKDRVKKAIGSVLTLTTIGVLINPSNSLAGTQEIEKCYGIVKAGMNDCETSTQSCASSSVKDNQPDAFIFLPKGLCEKMVGGKLAPSNQKKK